MGWVRCAEIVGGYQKRYFGALIPNTYIDNGTGAEVSYNNWSATDFLEIAGDELSVGRLGSNSIDDNYNVFYDENKVFISSFNVSDRPPITIPQNARYVRFSNNNSGISPTSYFYYPSNEGKIDSNIVFSNGEFLNTNIYKIIPSALGSQGVYVDSDGYLRIMSVSGLPLGTATGFTLSLNTPNIFTCICDCECVYDDAGFYFQGGTCSYGADAGSCVNTGEGRIKYVDTTATSGDKIAFTAQLDNASNMIFIGGVNYKIKSIFAFPGARKVNLQA